jgi:hypothetical protein
VRAAEELAGEEGGSAQGAQEGEVRERRKLLCDTMLEDENGLLN